MCEKQPHSPNRTQNRHRNRKIKRGVEKGIRQINSSGKNTIKNGFQEKKKKPGQKAAGLN